MKKTMRNTTYYLSVILILVFITHKAESRRITTDNEELKPYSRRSSAIDNYDITKFVNTLFKDAKKKNKQMKNRKRKLETNKKKINKNEGDDSNYDSLGLDDHVKNQIVRSNNPELSIKDIENLFHSSNAENYKKLGHILRSGGGLSINIAKEKEGKALRTAAGGSDEERSKLVFDLEEDEDGF